MPNGATVAHLLAPAASSTPDSASPSAIELSVGETTAHAVVTAICALVEHQAGGLTPKLRARSGENVAELYRLQITVGERDFPSMMRREGARACLDLGMNPATIDMTIAWLLEVLRRVTEIESAWTAPMPPGRN